MTRWGDIDMINRDEYQRLLAEIARLEAENKELREFVDKFQRKTAGMFE
jgi:cell division septum initiation protein DivIVA